MRDQMREKDNLDLLLDSALATYGDPGPDSGLEDRVVAAMATERAEADSRIAARRQQWLPWAIAIPVAVCLVLLWLFASTRIEQPLTQPQQARQAQPAPIVSPPAFTPAAKSSAKLGPKSAPRPPHTSPARLLDVRAQPAVATALPKLDVFPTPQPMTPQEQALTVVAAQSPVPLRKAIIDAQEHSDAPLHIAAIHIPPLEPPDEGQH